jgi:hypothetical protein
MLGLWQEWPLVSFPHFSSCLGETNAKFRRLVIIGATGVTGVIGTTGVGDGDREVIRGTDLNDPSKFYCDVTNEASALIGTETETEIEKKDQTTDLSSYAREYALAAVAEDTSDATAPKAINDVVHRAEAEKDTRETDTTTDAMKTRAADLLQGTTTEGSQSVPLADAETTRGRQGEIRVLLWNQEDITGTQADQRASTEQ